MSSTDCLSPAQEVNYLGVEIKVEITDEYARDSNDMKLGHASPGDIKVENAHTNESIPYCCEMYNYTLDSAEPENGFGKQDNFYVTCLSDGIEVKAGGSGTIYSTLKVEQEQMQAKNEMQVMEADTNRVIGVKSQLAYTEKMPTHNNERKNRLPNTNKRKRSVPNKISRCKESATNCPQKLFTKIKGSCSAKKQSNKNENTVHVSSHEEKRSKKKKSETDRKKDTSVSEFNKQIIAKFSKQIIQDTENDLSTSDQNNDNSITKPSDSVYECNACQYTGNKNNFLEHCKRVHCTDPQYQIHNCGQCSKTFCLRKDLTKHVARIHSTTQVYCELCGNSFKSKQNLQAHLKTFHARIKEVQCNICGGIFSQKSCLVTHMHRRHPDERPPDVRHRSNPNDSGGPYDCHFCGK